MGGAAQQAFNRLLELVRNTAGADRETARLRLLELFETVGSTDPAVLKARRDLMSALF
jgi:putative thioredoxin